MKLETEISLNFYSERLYGEYNIIIRGIETIIIYFN